MRKKHHQARKLRKVEGALFRAGKRLQEMDDPFEDSESEEYRSKSPGLFRQRGFGGLMPLSAMEDDFGEELSAYAAAFRRMGRRLDRWDGHKGIDFGVVGTSRVQHSAPINGVEGDTEDEKPIGGGDGDEEDLDEMDKEILGLGSENDDEEDLDDVEKALLGLRGDETEEELSDGGMILD
jgi:Ino eighty subunit 1